MRTHKQMHANQRDRQHQVTYELRAAQRTKRDDRVDSKGFREFTVRAALE